MGKIIGCGLNYRAHAQEMGDALPTQPLLFAKAPSSIAGPYDDLVLPPAAWSSEVDYEVELGVVIGHACHEVSVADALAYVAGYTIVNDVTARDIQRAESQWYRAKSYDGFSPIGPYLITADEIFDPQNLYLSTTVNGELRQRSNTSDMIFSVAELVSFASHSMTLLPGDIIATGTPAGIGAGMNPPRFLQPGDVLELTIEYLGKQRYTVASYQPSAS
jgi:2-keto-4-pentenoate hydratase/2-oxohepta-3-ene-1,7-dioic acid hydratase in catechol pathway